MSTQGERDYPYLLFYPTVEVLAIPPLLPQSLQFLDYNHILSSYFGPIFGFIFILTAHFITGKDIYLSLNIWGYCIHLFVILLVCCDMTLLSMLELAILINSNLCLIKKTAENPQKIVYRWSCVRSIVCHSLLLLCFFTFVDCLTRRHFSGA